MTQEEFERNAEHVAPFLLPVPLTPPVPVSATPLGQVISTDDWALGSFAGCVAVCRTLFLFPSSGSDQCLFIERGCSLYHRV
jgi:hypothetical protein